jgi:bifunctional polynucleotide phosphatase/kinase
MPPTIHNINNATFKDKMASFDYDWTMVNPIAGQTFPTNIDDWKWYSDEVPKMIHKFSEDDFMIVIFTNQSKSWKCDQIKIVCESLHIPLFIVIANVKTEYKPNRLMFDNLIQGKFVNKEESFFVGDALGRKTDFSDSDKVFAENIGIKWISPEEMFLSRSFVVPSIELHDSPEIIIMVGYPGSGKTTIANSICKNKNYIHISSDKFKSITTRMIKYSLDFMNQKKSIVFDATNSSVKKRKLYITLSLKHNYRVRCIHVTTPLDMSYKRNKMRADEYQVPKIAYSIYNKHYDEPTAEEGFELLRL